MSAKHALLGLLLNRPAYPYELANRLQERLGPAWRINSGHLYQTIDRLERDGLIEPVDGPAGGRDDRNVYAITELGVEEFESWFGETIDRARLSRRPLLAKITLAGPERLKAVLEQIDAYAVDCAEQLKELSKKREKVHVDSLPVRADHVLLRLGLSADIFQMRGELRWARHAREMVSWLLEQEVVWPTERSAGPTDVSWERERVTGRMFERIAASHSASTAAGQGSGDES